MKNTDQPKEINLIKVGLTLLITIMVVIVGIIEIPKLMKSKGNDASDSSVQETASEKVFHEFPESKEYETYFDPENMAPEIDGETYPDIESYDKVLSYTLAEAKEDSEQVLVIRLEYLPDMYETHAFIVKDGNVQEAEIASDQTDKADWIQIDTIHAQAVVREPQVPDTVSVQDVVSHRDQYIGKGITVYGLWPQQADELFISSDDLQSRVYIQGPARYTEEVMPDGKHVSYTGVLSEANGKLILITDYSLLEQCRGIIRHHPINCPADAPVEYALYDINKDNTPELIIRQNYSEYYIYALNGEEMMQYATEYWSYGNCLYQNDHGIVVYDGSFGSMHYEYVYLFTMQDNELKMKEVLKSTEECSYDDIRQYLQNLTPIEFHSNTDLSFLEEQLQ